jgi:hypothetical protein
VLYNILFLILVFTLQSLQLEQDNEKNKVTKENAKFLQDKINVIEHKLSKIYSDKAKGAQIRSRIKWVEEGGTFLYG